METMFVAAPLGCGDCVCPLFYNLVLGALSSFTSLLLGKEETVNLLCVVAVCILCPFLVVSWVGLHSVIVAFPSHTKL